MADGTNLELIIFEYATRSCLILNEILVFDKDSVLKQLS